MKDKDPTGRNAKQPGAKLDAGKNRLALCIGGFARALEQVGIITTYGTIKYTPGGWKKVPDAEERYMDAAFRHLLKHLQGERLDPESKHPHLAHAAWNILAVLEFANTPKGK